MFSEHVFWSCCSIPHVLEVLSAHCSDVVRRHRPLATTVYSMFPLALTTSGNIWWSFRPRLAKPGRAEHSNLQRCDTIFHNPILFLAYHLHRWKWHHCGVRYFLDLADQLSCRKSCYSAHDPFTMKGWWWISHSYSLQPCWPVKKGRSEWCELTAESRAFTCPAFFFASLRRLDGWFCGRCVRMWVWGCRSAFLYIYIYMEPHIYIYIYIYM